jgi:hypothetical protein
MQVQVKYGDELKIKTGPVTCSTLFPPINDKANLEEVERGKEPQNRNTLNVHDEATADAGVEKKKNCIRNNTLCL